MATAMYIVDARNEFKGTHKYAGDPQRLQEWKDQLQRLGNNGTSDIKRLAYQILLGNIKLTQQDNKLLVDYAAAEAQTTAAMALYNATDLAHKPLYVHAERSQGYNKPYTFAEERRDDNRAFEIEIKKAQLLNIPPLRLTEARKIKPKDKQLINSYFRDFYKDRTEHNKAINKHNNIR